MLISTENGDTVLYQRKIKMSVRYELLPRTIMKKGMFYLRTDTWMRVSPKWLDSHEEENKFNLAKRGNGYEAEMTCQQEGNRVSLARKERRAQGHDGLLVKYKALSCRQVMPTRREGMCTLLERTQEGRSSTRSWHFTMLLATYVRNAYGLAMFWH